jgi:hypothetical protein
MRYAILGMLLAMTSTSFADGNARGFKIENGKIVNAQNACGICGNSRTSCVLACNGAGTCIQACDDQYRDCVVENCRRRY